MSIIISNISPEDAPMEGVNEYEVRINKKLICEFKHDRGLGGLAQCLRDAADAVDAQEAKRRAFLIELASNGARLDDLLG